MECKGCEKNVTCVERRYFGGNPKTCKDFKKKTHYTLEEIAQKLCKSYEECTEGECPVKWLFVDLGGDGYNECSCLRWKNGKHTGYPPDFDYYPNCGARMDGGNDHG